MIVEPNVEYLRERHAYWMERLSRKGIWDARKFGTVELVVRKCCRSYLGLFQRRRVMSDNRRLLCDRIVIYKQDRDMSAREIDDTLVHEMIHQYIFQNDMHDTSAHGRLFREYMRRINRAFPDELNIVVSGRKSVRKAGPGPKTYKLLLVYMNDDTVYCCRVMPSKTDEFMRLVKRGGSVPGLKDCRLCESNDMFFESVRACRSRLHGLRMPLSELRDFCRKYHIRE